MRDLLFKFAKLLSETDHFVCRVCGRAFYCIADIRKGSIRSRDIFECAHASNGLDATNTGSDTALAHYSEYADITGAFNVRTTAQFHRKAIGAHRQYAHLVTVFLPEQCRGARLYGGVHAHLLGEYLGVTTHLVIHNFRDLR